MASATQELEAFVRESLQHGLGRESIKNVLLQAGWTSAQVESALDAFSDQRFPVPVPRPRPYLSAREAFLYLVLFSTLYFGSYNLGSLLFDFINRAFPDPTARTNSFITDSMSWATAALIIALPLFMFMSRYMGKELTKNPVKRLSIVRRWLTYLTLFPVAIILIGDLTTLVYNLLRGELTVRFVLKVLVIGLIGGTLFSYYLWDLRKEEREP